MASQANCPARFAFLARNRQGAVAFSNKIPPVSRAKNQSHQHPKHRQTSAGSDHLAPNFLWQECTEINVRLFRLEGFRFGGYTEGGQYRNEDEVR
jgi:hypothetical protein